MTKTKQTDLSDLMSWILVVPFCAYIYCYLHLYATHASAFNVHTMYFDIVGFVWILTSASILFEAAFSLIKVINNDRTRSYTNLIVFGICAYAMIRHGQSQTSSWNPFAANNLFRDIANVPTFFRDVESNVCGNLKRVSGGAGLLFTRLGSGCATRVTFGVK
jgi:hypothetical protein